MAERRHVLALYQSAAGGRTNTKICHFFAFDFLCGTHTHTGGVSLMSGETLKEVNSIVSVVAILLVILPSNRLATKIGHVTGKKP